ncbi:hypothetical protein, partial [Bartonella henselae]
GSGSGSPFATKIFYQKYPILKLKNIVLLLNSPFIKKQKDLKNLSENVKKKDKKMNGSLENHFQKYFKYFV